MLDYGPDYRPPQFSSLLDGWADTFGPDVADVCEAYGFAPDPEQRMLLDQVFAVDRDGLPCAMKGTIVAPRQNLKTGFGKMCALGWLFVTGEQLVTWSAHEFKTSREAFRDLKQLISDAPDLAGEIKAIYQGAGNESIELMSGQRLIFVARTKDGGRGFTGDKLILDEAYALTEDQMAALAPTLLTRPNAQLLEMSSAGMTSSHVLRDARDVGRKGGAPGEFYAEWCDPQPHSGCATDDCGHGHAAAGCALDDRDRWRVANPAYGRRMTEARMAFMRRTMTPAKFARECLGWWDEPTTAGSDMTVEDWQATVTDEAPSGRLVLAIDTAPSHAWASIVVAGNGILELVDRRRGSSWLPERVAGLCRDHGIAEVWMDPAGPVAGLIPDLEAAGVQLRLLNGADAAAACGSLVDAIGEQRVKVRHADAFLSAVAGASRRKTGDRWKWSRASSEVDISPLVAATWACWGWLADQSIEYDVLASAY